MDEGTVKRAYQELEGVMHDLDLMIAEDGEFFDEVNTTNDEFNELLEMLDGDGSTNDEIFDMLRRIDEGLSVTEGRLEVIERRVSSARNRFDDAKGLLKSQ